MAHFAQINSKNVVERVLVVGNDQEHRGQDFLANDLKLGGTWVQTSYSGNFRGKFAGIGDTYREDLDIFVSMEPFFLNAANHDDLQKLSGIGPAISSKIILEREENGPFKSLIDLAIRVDGVSLEMINAWQNVYFEEF